MLQNHSGRVRARSNHDEPGAEGRTDLLNNLPRIARAGAWRKRRSTRRTFVGSDRRKLTGFAGLYALVLLFSCVASAQNAGDQTQAIISALKQNDYSLALQLTEAGLRQSPGSPQMWTLRAMAF